MKQIRLYLKRSGKQNSLTVIREKNIALQQGRSKMDSAARTPKSVRSQMSTGDWEGRADLVIRQHNFGRTRNWNAATEKSDDRTKQCL